jgi:hypothetical protein
VRGPRRSPGNGLGFSGGLTIISRLPLINNKNCRLGGTQNYGAEFQRNLTLVVIRALVLIQGLNTIAAFHGIEPCVLQRYSSSVDPISKFVIWDKFAVDGQAISKFQCASCQC